MPPVIQSANDAVREGSTYLLYGLPGSGKTFSVATAPDPLLLLTERSAAEGLSKRNIERIHGKATPGVTYDIPMIEAFSYEALLEAMDYVFIDPDSRRFKTIFVDSITEAATIYYKHFRTIHPTGWEPYTFMAEEVMAIINACIADTSRNYIMTAHSAMVEDELKVNRLTPLFPGKVLGGAIPHRVANWFCATTEVDKSNVTQHVFHTENSPVARAKCRRGGLDPVEPQNWGTILEKMS